MLDSSIKDPIISLNQPVRLHRRFPISVTLCQLYKTFFDATDMLQKYSLGPRQIILAQYSGTTCSAARVGFTPYSQTLGQRKKNSSRTNTRVAKVIKPFTAVYTSVPKLECLSLGGLSYPVYCLSVRLGPSRAEHL